MASDLNALNSLFEDAIEQEEKRAERKQASVVQPSTVVSGSQIRMPQQGEKKQEKAKTADPNAIWDAEEVDTPHMAALKVNDGRKVPEYDIVYKQSVGSETVYLGMDDIDPSSNCCQELVIKVKLPGQQFKDLDLDVQKQSMIVSSPDYRLATYLPLPVDHESGSAKWIADKCTLAITLPIIDA